MYPHQDDEAMPPPNDDDAAVYNPYPVVVTSPRSDIVPQPDVDSHYYSSQYQALSYPDAYPQPCLQDYSQYPPRLHIQTDLQSQHHDPQSPYAYDPSSTSTLTSYPLPTPLSVRPHTAFSEHTEYMYDSPDGQTGPVQQPPYRVSQPEAPAISLWNPSPSADSPLQSYPRSESEPVDASHRWSPAYNDFHPSPPYTPPALSYYQDPCGQSQPHGEQLAVADMYRPDMPHPHASQYTSAPLPQGVYSHDQHQGMLPPQVIHEGPMSLSHAASSFEHTSHVPMNLEHLPVVNSEVRHHASAFHPQPPPPSEGIFDSPLREPIRDSIEEGPDYHRYHSSLLAPDAERGFMHNMQAETALQEDLPPSSVISEAGPSWSSSSANDYHQPPYSHSSTDQHERHLPPHSVLGLHSHPQLSPAGPQPAHAVPSFQGSLRQSPMQEEHLSGVRTPTGETERGPIRPPQLLEPEPIPRLSHPRRTPVSGRGEGDSIPPSYLTPTRSDRRMSPSSRPRSVSMDQQLPQAPVVPSQSHLATRRDRTDRSNRHHSQPSFRPFHPYPVHQRAGASEGSFPGGNDTGGICIPPTPVFGLFGSYPLSRGPREQPLPGPTCAPESSSSVMRLVLTPPFKRPPPPPPPPPVLPTRRPRMACFFCRKRKIACGPGPPTPPRSAQGGKDTEENEKDPPCNQCARRGLECARPTESRRGVRRGKGRGREEEDGEDDEESSPSADNSRVALALTTRPRSEGDETVSSDEDSSLDLDVDNCDEGPSKVRANLTRKVEEQ